MMLLLCCTFCLLLRYYPGSVGLCSLRFGFVIGFRMLSLFLIISVSIGVRCSQVWKESLRRVVSVVLFKYRRILLDKLYTQRILVCLLKWASVMQKELRVVLFLGRPLYLDKPVNAINRASQCRTDTHGRLFIILSIFHLIKSNQCFVRIDWSYCDESTEKEVAFQQIPARYCKKAKRQTLLSIPVNSRSWVHDWPPSRVPCPKNQAWPRTQAEPPRPCRTRR